MRSTLCNHLAIFVKNLRKFSGSASTKPSFLSAFPGKREQLRNLGSMPGVFESEGQSSPPSVMENGLQNGTDDDQQTGSKRSLHPWELPVNSKEQARLHLLNSFTRQKELFVPRQGNKVQWYICGPTVYDSAHMGHARAYLSFDILRRVLEFYFGYEVLYVMNITDIDDKIIKRARQKFLWTKYVGQKEEANVVEILNDVMSALKPFKLRYEQETDPDKKRTLHFTLEKVDQATIGLEEALKGKDPVAIENAKQALILDSKDVVAEWLDAAHGHTVNDHSVFSALARLYENEFHADMTRLGVLPPDVVTRVSEYVPEIVEYIQRIVNNGYGYETADGSIYFDTVKFDSKPNHYYAKLQPGNFGNKAQLQNNMRESEGELSIGEDRMKEKRNATDFALWKASKAGEPYWDSPWGKGRPGWHIECSVMASSICGENLDIHAGGFDLKFPHHDNEIAQAEAHNESDDWVNYFLHCGTLRIAGMKMSKSLKNFIRIDEALSRYTARQLRILFLRSDWSDALDYSNETMELALQYENKMSEFFLSVKHYLRNHYKPDTADAYRKYEDSELKLVDQFMGLKEQVHNALCDSVDTRTVMDKLRELKDLGNSYIGEKERLHSVPNCLLLRDIAAYITSMFRVFGVVPHQTDIGFPVEGEGAQVDKETLVMPYLNALADFRRTVRLSAVDLKATDILKECDRLRNEVLPNLGVRLEDRLNETMVKLVDPEILLAEKRQQEEMERRKQAEKERKQMEKELKEQQARIEPSLLFTQGPDAEKYSKFDSKGIPTHTADGEEISKKQRKKLEKTFETHEKKYMEIMEKEQQ